MITGSFVSSKMRAVCARAGGGGIIYSKFGQKIITDRCQFRARLLCLTTPPPSSYPDLHTVVIQREHRHACDSTGVPAPGWGLAQPRCAVTSQPSPQHPRTSASPSCHSQHAFTTTFTPGPGLLYQHMERSKSCSYTGTRNSFVPSNTTPSWPRS